MARASAGGVRVEGLNAVVRALLAIGLDVEDLKDAFGSIAAEGARIAAGFVHSRSGRLAGTLRGNRARNKAVIVAGRGRVKYAGVANYGWPRRNIEPQRFMQRADAVLQPVAVARLEQAINDAIRRRGL
jgi:hypothetical protein